MIKPTRPGYSPGWYGIDLLGFFTISLTAPRRALRGTYMLVAIPIGLGMGTFMSVNNTVMMSAVPGHLRGFAAGMLETTCPGRPHVGRTAGKQHYDRVAGVTLTAQNRPDALYSGFSGRLYGRGLYRAHRSGRGLCARGPQVASVQARRTGTAGRQHEA